MKSPVYVRCPRCELNYIQKKDKFCNVCKLEMKALGSLDIEDNLDLELCPICKANYINPDEDMCVACAKERALEEGLSNDKDGQDTGWEDFDNDDGRYSEDEETGEMVSITDLDDDDVLEDGDDLSLTEDDDLDSDKIEEDENEDDFDDVFDDLDDDFDDED